MEIKVFITFCIETDNMEYEGSLSMEIEGIPSGEGSAKEEGGWGRWSLDV